ncbi:glutaminase A [Bacillus sp. RG28]|uniref:Glutaminase n=1 Tax=Gottfriedia endophytica TaxID=2820819 RepID=A0A940SLJ8_9BACI|nr:glutaminase A [Gottfriedia endophytica]MBP0727204.1 glutaminase A [Gottfriedia endophytica]
MTPNGFREELVVKTIQELNELIEKAREFIPYGKVASYIPALARANKKDLSVAVYLPDGRHYEAGDTSTKFTLQSISKVIVLALVLMDRGEDYVFERVGMEPTGDPFNSIAKLEKTSAGKPLNPMINAGALAVTSMIKGINVEDRFDRLMDFVRLLTGNPELSYSEEVAKSEFETAHLNRSLCFFMKEHGIITEDVEKLLDLYTKQCSIEVNCLELAKIGLVFSLNGWDPVTKQQVIPEKIAQICNTFMVTCGMYNASGEFAIKVGIPAKSGVSGGVMGAVPRRFGIGVYGPSLDEIGNSIAGIKLLELLSKHYNLSIF